MSEGEVGKTSNAQLCEIGKRQKQILWMILICLVANIASRLLQAPVLIIVAALFQFYFVYKLAKSVGSMAWPYIILLFIPLLGLIGLFVLSDKATKILKNHGLKVGLMGVPSKELLKLQESE